MGNSTLLIDPSQGPTKELLQYLRDLPVQHKAMIMDAVEDPIKKAKTAVLMNTGAILPPKPTKEQINLTVRDCYNDIVQGKVYENYIEAIHDTIVSSYKENRYGEKEGVEQLVSLASRLVKGEECLECMISFQSPTRGSDVLHRVLCEGIHKIVGDERDADKQWSLSLKSRSALDKLCRIFPTPYRPLRYLLGKKNPWSRMYETMWCHVNVHSIGGHGKDDKGEQKMICKCWDEGYEGVHCKTCYWGEHGEGYYLVK
jgi:hypothetical protein